MTDQATIGTDGKILARITPAQYSLLEALRRVDFGQVTVMVQDGRPTRIEVLIKSIRLDGAASDASMHGLDTIPLSSG